ncbi:glycosyltransferase [Arcobacter sp. CECT 8985]|uniref:glycosyltransferase n=1 Tax=Arcobacter sp. CECT 8985 TaxID=1935424 RepID=UPI00100A6A4A|nr:glycosyltransferase [Arcobacter sp. CECT 8985]RXJ86298.1 glycosyl transferase family 1 [Arcobacter sp. CECT 8985]
MKNFLYITDQDEYTDHSFIGAFFEKYLGKHMNVHILYFSHYKADFEKKDSKRFVLPLKFKNNLLKELEKNQIDIKSYDFIVVRNDIELLKDIQKAKIRYNYKVGFRLSFPKRIAKLKEDEANNKKTFFDIIGDKIQSYKETNIINECDIFIPSTNQMKEEFFSSINIKTFPVPTGIDPEMLHENIQHVEDFKRFIYAGTLDNLRKFETILEAFSQINNNLFRIVISTKDPEYAKNMILKYPNLKNCIEIHNAKNKQELLDLIAKADIGLSILPNIALFNTSTSIKIIDYYSSAVPCIMTNNAKNNTLFKDNVEAWFCDFNKKSIKAKIEELLTLSKEEVAKVGENGQKKLLDIRNYEKIAQDFATELNLI